MSTHLTDIEIAQAAKLHPIQEVAAEAGLSPDEILLYGKYKAKISVDASKQRKASGKLVLVTGINPTSFGEGKSTCTIGVAQALRLLGKKAMVCLRQPSLGPVFGVKGGAAGGGYSQVVPMEEINLHFTGDFHAVATAHNLLAAMTDNHIYQGNALDIQRVVWPRTMDMNDRALRRIRVAMGEKRENLARDDSFVIVAASEIMAILCLANDLQDLENKLGNIIVGLNSKNEPIRARDLKAEGSMTLLLKDALLPNLVQTLEGGPAFVHGGPFANIAHGCNTIVATKLALSLSEFTLTEAGFGSDLGAEKFLNIKCRLGGLKPDAVILVATVRALKLNGGANKTELMKENLSALEKGIVNLQAHVENLRQFGLPVLVALNKFSVDTQAELDFVLNACKQWKVHAALSEGWAHGGKGCENVAKELLEIFKKEKSNYKPLYETSLPIKKKIEIIATKVYGADGVDYTPQAEASMQRAEACGLAHTPVCIAKTQYSFSDDPTKLGRPQNYRLKIRDVTLSAGAGFVVALAGDIMTMPGLSKSPAAEKIHIHPNGKIEGLF
ncbi:MAG: formate--tetrahydrofolate ligase [Verrucomicrobiota bacterium]